MEIPVLDFSVYEHVNANVSADLEKLSEELKRAFTEVGFVYLKNTGITQEQVEKAMSVSKEFFILPEDTKKPFSTGKFSCYKKHGWISVETESLNPRRPGDLKEAYNIKSLREDIDWPSDDFRDALVSFFLHCKELSLRVLRLMALGLGLDSEFFLNAHKQIGSDVNLNPTTLRSLYYPPVNSTCVKENQLRCGEHSDFGSITLLFQSPESGLQVKNRAGEYVSAPSIPGTVLINIADLMQRWTSDVYVSAKHRVLLPPAGDSSTRQSLAFFVNPDDEAMISCCDGSDNTCVKENQLRCGEHSDYGSITLLFQSPESGLQVKNRAGEYVSAPSIPGTVLINIADLMQRWTSDVYVSAAHRVLLPPAGDSSTRQSLAFFVHPDDEAMISCCDGSDKYPPINSFDYLMSRFNDTYGKKQAVV